MAQMGAEKVAAGDVPHLRAPVGACGGEARPVRSQGDAEHLAGVRGAERTVDARRAVVHHHLAAAATCRDGRAVLAGAHRGHRGEPALNRRAIARHAVETSTVSPRPATRTLSPPNAAPGRGRERPLRLAGGRIEDRQWTVADDDGEKRTVGAEGDVGDRRARSRTVRCEPATSGPEPRLAYDAAALWRAAAFSSVLLAHRRRVDHRRRARPPRPTALAPRALGVVAAVGRLLPLVTGDHTSPTSSPESSSSASLRPQPPHWSVSGASRRAA